MVLKFGQDYINQQKKKNPNQINNNNNIIRNLNLSKIKNRPTNYNNLERNYLNLNKINSYNIYKIIIKKLIQL